MPPVKKRSRTDERPDDIDESQDAPTVQLSLFSDNGDVENAFAQLGSVTGKLESFNALAQRKVKTLSTVPSESAAILPSTTFASESISSTSSVKDWKGIATRVMLESVSSKQLNSRHNIFFDHFNYHYFSCLANSSLFHEAICSFAVSSTEEKAQWGVIRIPGSFDSCTTILFEYSGEEPVLYVSFESGDILIPGLTAFGIDIEEISPLEGDVVGEDTADSPSSESTSRRRDEFSSSLKIPGKRNVFGFFDFLRNHNRSFSREISIFASFPFTHAKYTCAKISVYKSATSFSGNIAQIDNISMPLSVLDSIVGIVDSDVKATVTIDRKTYSCFSTRRPRDNDDQVIHLVKHNHS